jgi:hypothetical protein
VTRRSSSSVVSPRATRRSAASVRLRVPLRYASFLQLPDRALLDDQFAQLVVQVEDLGNRLAPAITGATAIAAAAAAAEIETRQIVGGEMKALEFGIARRQASLQRGQFTRSRRCAQMPLSAEAKA